MSASEAFSTIGRTSATAASSGGPGGRLASSAGSSPIAFAARDISRQQASAKLLGIDRAAAVQDGIDQRDADGAAEIAHQVE